MRTPGKIRLVLALAIVTAVVVLAVVIFLRLPIRKQPPIALHPPGRSADLALQVIRFTETGKGKTKWTLLADRADYDTAHSVVNLFGVRLSLSAGGKVGDLVLTAAKADYNTDSKEVSLGGGVKAQTSSGMEFTTEEVHFDSKQGVVTSDAPVRFSDGRITVEGIGMEFLLKNSSLHLKSAVKATVKGGSAK